MKSDTSLLMKNAAGLFPSDAPAIQILNALNTGVVVTTEDGSITFVNVYAAEILKCNKADLQKRKVEDILFPFSDIQESIENESKDAPRQERKITLRTGEEITIGFQVSKVKSPESKTGPVQYALAFQDISKWNALHRDRDRLLKIATVGDVLPTILHELKNPLAAITTAVEVLLEEVEENPPQTTKEALQAIFSEIRRMKLVFEGIGATHRELHSPVPKAVDEAIREAVFVLKARAKSGGVDLSCEMKQMPPLLLDTAVVRAILFNLLSNAIDACRSGDKIIVTADLKEDHTVFEMVVSDTGCGMSEDVQEHATELFMTTKPNGSGIGLSLCKNTVEAAGGLFQINSQVNSGTRITVSVPLSSPKSAVSGILKS